MSKEEKLAFKDKIAKIFLQARENNKWSQEQVAERAKLTPNYYARIERGGIKAPLARGYVLDNIARALEIKLVLPLD